MGKRGPVPTFDHDAAIALYATGDFTLAQIAGLNGVSEPAVHKVIKRAAPHLLGRRRLPTFDVASAMARVEMGATFREVGEQHNVSLQTIHHHYLKHQSQRLEVQHASR